MRIVQNLLGQVAIATVAVGDSAFRALHEGQLLRRVVGHVDLHVVDVPM